MSAESKHKLYKNEPNKPGNMRVHVKGFGAIGTSFMPLKCQACAFVGTPGTPGTEGLLKGWAKPNEGDLEYCPSCQAFRVWRKGKFRPARQIDLQRKLVAEADLPPEEHSKFRQMSAAAQRLPPSAMPWE
jgi:hypothetical protein